VSTPWWPLPTQPTVLQQLALRFGRRGLKLIVLGACFVCYGGQIALGPHTERFSRPGPSPLDWADSRGWGILFLLGGLVALVAGLQRRAAPDWIGFAALVGPALIWTLLYAMSYVVWMGTGGDYGEPSRWVYALIWLAVATSIRIDAGWDDPTDPMAAP
jgi:hypothetical protein